MRNIRIQSLRVANLSCVAQTGLESMLPIGTPQKPFSANCWCGFIWNGQSWSPLIPPATVPVGAVPPDLNIDALGHLEVLGLAGVAGGASAPAGPSLSSPPPASQPGGFGFFIF